MRKGPLVILVADDDENDTLLLERAFKKVGVEMPVRVCRDGAEAMEYLKGEGKYADRTEYPFPRVVVTDLKMPKCTGFDLLQWLQNHPECNLIPKIVLSASRHESDVVLAYQLGLNAYFTKPTTFSELCEIVEIAQRFWTAAEIPPLPNKC